MRWLIGLALSLVLAATGASAESLWDCYKAETAYKAGNDTLAIEHYTRCINSGDLTIGHLANAHNSRGLAYERTSFPTLVARCNPRFTVGVMI